jgi:tetratricopeptide (TPR) repeat protein
MLTLIGAGWGSVRSSAKHGTRTETLTRLLNLLARPDLPTSVACQAHRLAGELLLESELYAKARRHLRIAAELQDTHAETYYLWALAHEHDPLGSDRLAAKRFRKACELEPTNANYRAAFGRAAIRCGSLKRGRTELLEAARLAPGKLAVIRVVVAGLIEAGRLTDARRVLNQARFLCFGTVEERELNVWLERVRFESARYEQRETTRHRQDAEFAMDGGRVVLPLIRIVQESAVDASSDSAEDRAIRADLISFPRPHFPRFRLRRADR